MQRKRSTLEAIVEPIGAICLLAIVGLIVYLVVIEQKGWLSLSLIPPAFVAFLMMRLSDVTKIHVFRAFEAELKQRLEEVNATIDDLHDLAETFATVSVQQLKYGNRMAGISPRLQRTMIDDIVGKLRKLEMEEAKIDQIIALERPTEHFDYFHYVMKASHKVMNGEQSKAWEDWSKPFIQKGFGAEPSPDETEKFLASNGLLVDEIKERLDDYRQYHLFGTHRRLDSWLDRYVQS